MGRLTRFSPQDALGCVAGDELLKILSEVYGHSRSHITNPTLPRDEHFDVDNKVATDELVKRTGHGITQGTFEEFARRHPNALVPAFRIQHKVRGW